MEKWATNKKRGTKMVEKAKQQYDEIAKSGRFPVNYDGCLKKKKPSYYVEEEEKIPEINHFEIDYHDWEA